MKIIFYAILVTYFIVWLIGFWSLKISYRITFIMIPKMMIKTSTRSKAKDDNYSEEFL